MIHDDSVNDFSILNIMRPLLMVRMVFLESP